ncbi:MAG: helix-turn-helix domain-containing protein [Chromatiales bacterium]|nr:helix-turn-helix domain-containing protein [Chromatiales bacterium]
MRRKSVKRGETLFRKGSPFISFFAVKSGSFKAFIPHQDQVDQIVGFHLAGELIGTEGLASERYPYSVRALENSSVCELCLERLPESGRSRDVLQQAVIKLLGEEVAFGRELIASLVHQSAEQRIAGFILDIYKRLTRRKMVTGTYLLSMSRSDIGNYLGLASETVSRILTKFQKRGLVKLEHKRVTILDFETMESISRQQD